MTDIDLAALLALTEQQKAWSRLWKATAKSYRSGAGAWMEWEEQAVDRALEAESTVEQQAAELARLRRVVEAARVVMSIPTPGAHGSRIAWSQASNELRAALESAEPGAPAE